jgi:hypothetical protein
MAGDLFGYTSFQAVSAESDGVSRSPVYTFESELSLGLYRSGASTLALSYGTLNLASATVAMGVTSQATSTFSGSITVARSGYTGTPLLAFSATSFALPAQVVQGSASTFTIFVWPAVRNGDAVQVTPGLNAGVSSLSSGLVMHSHCTQNGQCEVRISNVSTLVQNQSAITCFIYRWSAF